MIDGFQHFAAHLSGQSGQMKFLTYRDLEIVLFFWGYDLLSLKDSNPGRLVGKREGFLWSADHLNNSNVSLLPS